MAAVLVWLLLAAAAGDLCVGWHPSADARMACCAEGACGMHGGAGRTVASGADGGHDTHATPRARSTPSQDEADACCAMSASQAAAASGAFALDVTLDPVDDSPLSLTAVTQTVAGAPAPPRLHSAGVARHVLISVFRI